VSHSRPRSVRLVLGAALLALVLPLSGCLQSFLPPTVSQTSTPTDEKVAANLESYYGQHLRWTGCGEKLQCATADAPLDWTDPQRSTIQLALVRQQATSGTALGSLLVNPGGPGGSGYDFIKDSIDYATSARLQANYDIVGFDPRGVNHSSAVSCYSDPAEFDSFLFDIVPAPYGSDEWISKVEDSNRDFAASCATHTGELLGFVDTISAARDLDLLRAILGDATLNYLGYSYGTLLGATYAELYPKRTGRLVLDGALDPTTSSFDVSAMQAKGFESALRAFLVDCATATDCPFTGSTDSSMTQIRALLDRLDASPLRAADGRQLGSATMTTAIILPLYNKTTWPYLRQLFTEVMRGGTDLAFVLADNYYGRAADGTYSDNSTEAFLAINCLDYSSNPDLTQMRAEQAELTSIAPVLGPQLAFGGTSCIDWPYPAAGQRGPIHAAGSSDILVVGTRNDPATPYVWAQSLAAQLDNGHLVTYEGEGHTGYNKGSMCVDTTVDDYFINGTVPATDPDCLPD
jgi:pimeloyl-ACP methyl ester carboxylesterase